MFNSSSQNLIFFQFKTDYLAYNTRWAIEYMHVSDNRYSRIISKANTSGDNKEESSQSKANKQKKAFAGEDRAV